MRAQVASLVLAVNFIVAGAPSVWSQSAAEWPARPVKIITPEAPGGGMDRGGRALGEVLAKELGQPFVVENMPGAANTIGTAAAARAKPDGYTLLHTSQSAIAIVPLVMRSSNYNASDLIPVSQTMATTNTFVINPEKVPARNLKELIALLKESPNKYTYGSSGVGGWSHLIHELFMLKTGTKIKHVPYGSAPAVRQAILGGHVDMGIVSTTVVLGDVRSGSLIAIAVPAPKRLPQMPDVPAINEVVSDFGGLLTWNGIFAPAGTPQPVIEKLSAAVAKAVHEPSVVEVIRSVGADPVGSSPKDFASFVQREVDVWQGVIAASGVKVD